MQDESKNEIKEAVLGLNGTNKTLTSTKRLSFNNETMKRIEMMLPLYKEQFAENLNESEKIAALIEIAVKNLFTTDFAEKMKDFS